MAMARLSCVMLAWASFTLLSCAEAKGAQDEASAKKLKEVDNLIVKGRSHYKDAVHLLDKLLEEDPNNQKALYKRAEVRDILKDYHVALGDLATLLSLHPDSKQAYQLRSKIYTKQGQLRDAVADWTVLRDIYSKSTSQHEKNKKYKEAVERINELSFLAKEEETIDALLNKSPEDKAVLNRCVHAMRKLTKEARDTDKYRLKLIDCALAAKDHDTVSNELTRILTLQPQNLGAMHLKALSLKSIGAMDAAMANIKKCLSLDPEHKDCMALHKSIKKYNKITEAFEGLVNDRKWDKVLKIIDEAIALDANPFNIDRLLNQRCKAYQELRELDKAVEACTAAIDQAGENNPSTYELLLMRAEVHMLADDLDKAEQDVDAAGTLQPNDRRTSEARMRLEKLKKQAARKDYYAILGVKKTSSEKEIKKAYRQLAMKFHPDKVDTASMDEGEKEKVMQKFRDISDSHQILTNEEKRRRYDLGEDVEDDHHGGGQHHGGNPFFFQQRHGGGGGGNNFRFNQGGQGGFNFKFQ
ncbi:DnaJ-like protein subfamily C member 3-like protein [Diplonema papillatum]|nr:DnaJ-like protein subfamily C member 3-like protein [Diplonema papillatum]